MSVAERADDGVTVDAEMTRTLPAFAGAPFVGLGTASSELLRRAINDSVVATFGDGHPCGFSSTMDTFAANATVNACTARCSPPSDIPAPHCESA
ncbi:hypothetical protein [Rhodococcus opacus]|uniref:hypothetical protein n=1 Tax=Rhodococcus opacus TaxID=37919 RepID=UPI0039E7C40D